MTQRRQSNNVLAGLLAVKELTISNLQERVKILEGIMENLNIELQEYEEALDEYYQIIQKLQGLSEENKKHIGFIREPLQKKGKK